MLVCPRPELSDADTPVGQYEGGGLDGNVGQVQCKRVCCNLTLLIGRTVLLWSHSARGHIATHRVSVIGRGNWRSVAARIAARNAAKHPKFHDEVRM